MQRLQVTTQGPPNDHLEIPSDRPGAPSDHSEAPSDHTEIPIDHPETPSDLLDTQIDRPDILWSQPGARNGHSELKIFNHQQKIIKFYTTANSTLSFPTKVIFS